MGVAEILPAHTVKLIVTRQFKHLGPIYHDLDADADQQKQALLNEKIMLSSYELILFVLFKSLTSLTNYSASSFEHVHYFME